MRDRLIELIQNAVNGCARNWAEIIADHLLANGVIVPPCKIGDIVYFIYETYDEEGINRCVLDCKVEQLGIDSKSMWFKLKLPLGVKLIGYFRNNELDKTVFLTKEEAEQALKEREQNDG